MRWLVVLLLAAPPALAALSAGDSKQPDWVLSDITAMPELAAFFGNADAIITIKNDEKSTSPAPRPTVFIYKLQSKPKNKLTSSREWQAYIRRYINSGKRVVLSEDTSKNGRYILEFTSRNEAAESDLRSLYFAMQAPDGGVSLFVYDGIGPATAQNLPLVRALFSEMNSRRLLELHQADLVRRNLKPAKPQ